MLEAEPGATRGSGGIAHFGFRLLDPQDIEEAATAVEAAGGQIVGRGEFVPGEPYLFCRDPDGYDLEIWYELPTSADPPPEQDGYPARRGKVSTILFDAGSRLTRACSRRAGGARGDARAVPS